MRYLFFALVFLDSTIGASAIQAAPNTPPAIPAKPHAHAPPEMACAFVSSGVSTGFVTGRVTSSTTIQMPKFSCRRFGNPSDGGGDGSAGGGGIAFNSYGNHAHAIRNSIWGRYCPNRPWLTMTVQLANPADAGQMPLGRLVTLRGDFSVITQNKVRYWAVQNARILYTDPFGR